VSPLVTDRDFLRQVLQQGPASNLEILRLSFQQRGCGLTVHSRAAELRREIEQASHGLRTVTCRRDTVKNQHGKYAYIYQIENTIAVPPVAPGAGTAAAPPQSPATVGDPQLTLEI
jgi:hypothetical protein